MWTASRGWPLFIVIAVAAAGLDLATKAWLFSMLGMPGEKPPITLVPEILVLETNLNEGALFGMGQGMGMVFAAVSCAALVGIFATVAQVSVRQEPWLVVSLALITGGIVGNLYDRLGLPGLKWHAPLGRIGDPVYAVRDWIHFTLEGIIDWPIFNLADTWLVIGAGLLVVLSFLTKPAPHAD